MEVHAHTNTPLKKWTHYLWEFLMLFLAVFCGFFAENMRENVVDRHREKDYIISMIEDLKADTANLSFVLKDFGEIEKRLDFTMRGFSEGIKTYSAD